MSQAGSGRRCGGTSAHTIFGSESAVVQGAGVGPMEASLGSEIEQVYFSLLIGLDLVAGRMPYRHSCAVCGVVFVHLCCTAYVVCQLSFC